MDIPSISLFFPVYNDEKTVETMVEKSLQVLSSISDTYEVLIVNDGSPDKSGVVADQMAGRYPNKVRVIHHPRNLGYGAAVRTGLNNVRYDWVCFTDGDNEYDVEDLHKLIRLIRYYELIITFRYVKLYSSFRVFISWAYNSILRFLFRTQYRDVSTGLRLIRRSLLKELDLRANSPFIGAEIVIKTMLKGFPVGEVGIQTFPREFGKGASTSIKNILATIKDMLIAYRTIFSMDYDLPPNRRRED